MLPDSYKELSCIGRARSFLDNRLLTEPVWVHAREGFLFASKPDN